MAAMAHPVTTPRGMTGATEAATEVVASDATGGAADPHDDRAETTTRTPRAGTIEIASAKTVTSAAALVVAPPVAVEVAAAADVMVAATVVATVVAATETGGTGIGIVVIGAGTIVVMGPVHLGAIAICLTTGADPEETEMTAVVLAVPAVLHAEEIVMMTFLRRTDVDAARRLHRKRENRRPI